MKTWTIRIVTGAALGVAWASSALALPPDTQPGAQRLWVKCQVGEASKTSHCRLSQPPASDPDGRIARAEQAFLDANPISLPGAAVGMEVEVLARVRIGKTPDAQGVQVTPAEDLPIEAGPELHGPVWAHSPYEFWAGGFVPDRAYRERQPGVATVRCLVTATGALIDCWVVSESPAGWSFGVGAITTLTHARLKPPAAGQTPIAGAVFTGTFHFDGKELRWWEK